MLIILHKQNYHLLSRNNVADILMHEAQNLNANYEGSRI